MAYLKFIEKKDLLKCTVVPVGNNIVTLKFSGNVVVDTSGFDLFLDEEGEVDIGGGVYREFNTIYRNDETTEKYNGYQLSNDGSVYTPPVPKIYFYSDFGGKLEGETTQQVRRYEELVIPTPIPDENYVFKAWNPEIPKSGEIDSDKSYHATYTYVPPLSEVKENKKYELQNASAQEVDKGIEYKETVFPYGVADRNEIKTKLETAIKLDTSVIVYMSNQVQMQLTKEDITELYRQEEQNAIHHNTYLYQMFLYVDGLKNSDLVKAVTYGQELEGKYLEAYNTAVTQEKEIVEKYIESLSNTGGISPDVTNLEKQVKTLTEDVGTIKTNLSDVQQDLSSINDTLTEVYSNEKY